MPAGSTLDITGKKITLSTWAKAPTLPSGDSAVIDKRECPGCSTAGGGAYILWFSSGGNLRLGINDGSGLHQLTTTTSPVQANRWHYVTAVYDGTLSSDNMKIYVDGTLEAKKDLVDKNIASSLGKQLFFGCWEGVSNCFTGLMDEPAVYEESFSALQIQQIYAKGLLKNSLVME